MKTVNDIDFKGKRALIRVDFNVPLNDSLRVADSTRIEAAVPTIEKIIKDGGKVILMSHMGRPKGQVNSDMSLKNIQYKIEECLNTKIQFGGDCIGDEAVELSKSLKDGDVLLVENLRFYNEETKGDVHFAEKLARLGDIYVNDAFGTAHRAHASTAIIAQFFSLENKCFGLLMTKELNSIKMVLESPKKPSVAIVGGAKVSSKIDILKSLIERMDHIVIGGGMAYTFVKAQGGSIGNSLVEDDKMDLANELLQLAKDKGVEIHLPVDSVNADDFKNDAQIETTDIAAVSEGYMGLDIGPDSIRKFNEVLQKGKTILWNGPLGVFEMDNFSKGTVEVAQQLVRSTKDGAFTLVGGGDSVAAARQFNVAQDLSYISTGGGAMLESLEGKILPGVKAVLD